MKSINTIQKYPHITGSFANEFHELKSWWSLSIFIMIFLFLINFLISFGKCSTPELSKFTMLFAFTYKVIQLPIYLYSPPFTTCVSSFILGKLFFE